METSNLPNKEIKVMVIKIFTGLERKVEELSEKFKTEIENIKKNLSELKNIVKKNEFHSKESTADQRMQKD